MSMTFRGDGDTLREKILLEFSGLQFTCRDVGQRLGIKNGDVSSCFYWMQRKGILEICGEVRGKGIYRPLKLWQVTKENPQPKPGI